jgi:AmmeMemoRadiSam system protein A
MDHALLLKIARNAIEEAFDMASAIDRVSLVAEHPELLEKLATFVTLNIGEALRGCIGSLEPRLALIDDLVSNARGAAFRDPRFMPLTKEEYLRCSVEISLLTPPQPLAYSDSEDLKSKIRTGVDGVVLQKGDNKATFLPQVWEQLPTFELFFSHLGLKAGLGGDVLKMHPEILTYRVEHFKEGPLSG